MTLETGRLESFEKKHRYAMDYIRMFLESDNPEENPLRDLVNAILKTENHNFYSYLLSSESFSWFITKLRNCYSEGNVSFVSVNGEPRIVFANQYEIGFENKVLSDMEKDIQKRVPANKFDIRLLKGIPEFLLLLEGK